MKVNLIILGERIERIDVDDNHPVRDIKKYLKKQKPHLFDKKGKCTHSMSVNNVNVSSDSVYDGCKIFMSKHPYYSLKKEMDDGIKVGKSSRFKKIYEVYLKICRLEMDHGNYKSMTKKMKKRWSKYVNITRFFNKGIIPN